MIDKLIQQILLYKNPTAVGLDTAFGYLPEKIINSCNGDVKKACKEITNFNHRIIDAIKDVVPCVKVQIAYYEMYGIDGIIAFYDTIKYAKQSGLVVISDAKRNDIGSTAACYSSAFLGETAIGESKFTAFASDFLTVNPYLGGDGILPFVNDCKKYDKGIFVLVKTSNPTSGQLQNRLLDDGKTLFQTVGALVEEWGSDTVGKWGYSDVGAVVGATHPAELRQLREELAHTFFLIPGYGAQGGKADDLAPAFDKNGMGGIVNNSRGILCAYKTAKYSGKQFDEAARLACIDMKEDILQSLKRAGVNI